MRNLSRSPGMEASCSVLSATTPPQIFPSLLRLHFPTESRTTHSHGTHDNAVSSNICSGACKAAGTFENCVLVWLLLELVLPQRAPVKGQSAASRFRSFTTCFILFVTFQGLSAFKLTACTGFAASPADSAERFFFPQSGRQWCIMACTSWHTIESVDHWL